MEQSSLLDLEEIHRLIERLATLNIVSNGSDDRQEFLDGLCLLAGVVYIAPLDRRVK